MPLTIDEMEERLKAAPDVKEQIELMNEFAYLYKDLYPDYCKGVTVKALKKAQEVGWQRGLALARANWANVLFELSNFDEALDYLKQAERAIRGLQREERKGLNRILNSLGCIYQEKKEFSNAAACYREAINISEESNDTLLLGKIYSNLTYIHENLNQLERSLAYAKKAISMLEASCEFYILIVALNNAADTCGRMERYDEALGYLNRAYEITLSHSIEHMQGPVLRTLGGIYIDMGNYSEAERCLNKALKCSSTFEKPSYLVQSLIGLGRLNAAREEHQTALDYWQRALVICREKSIFRHLPKLNSYIYKSNKKLERYKSALFYLEEYNRLKEQDYSLEMERSVRNVEAESLKRSNERVKVISTIGRELTSKLNLEGLLDTIYESLNSLMDATIFGIAEYNSKRGNISFNKYIQEGIHLPIFYFNIEDPLSLAALAIREQRDIIINDLPQEIGRYLPVEEPTFIVVNEEDTKKANSVLVTPMQVENEVTGIVTVQSYRTGAYSHTDLDSLKILASYIAIALKNARQAELIKRKNEELKRLSVTDYLTGVYNRREFEKRLRQLWGNVAGKSRSLSILLLDADNFKKINDTYGHPAGDDCLKQLSALLTAKIDEEDSCLARYGGEEFIILLNYGKEEALRVAEELRAGVEGMEIYSGEERIALTVSVGISTIEPSLIGKGRRGAEQLISRADEALYRSKSEGRNRVTFLQF